MFEYVVRKGGLRESEARWFFQQLIVAVDYIHRMVGGRVCGWVAAAAAVLPWCTPVLEACVTPPLGLERRRVL